MKKTLLAVLLSLGFTAVQAEVTGNLSLNSDYRFRGISQTMQSAAFQGGVDYSHGSGLYIGNWNSNVSADQYAGTSGLESDIYAGIKKQFGQVSVDLGVLRYTYAGASSFNTTEVYLGAGVGPISAKVSQSTTDYFATANSKGTRYYEANLAQPIGPVTLVAHAGYTDVANQTANDYKDYSVGISKDLAGFTITSKYYVNDMTASYKTANTVNGKKLYENGVVVSVSKSF